MKYSLCLLLALNVAAFALGRPDGFIGIKWGASPEEAKRILQKREGLKIPEAADEYRMELTGGTFGGLPAAKWVLEFPGRQFSSASVVLNTSGNADVVFKELRRELTSKYGPPTTDKKLESGKKGTNVSKRREWFGSVATWKFSPNIKEKTAVVISTELSGPNGKSTDDESKLGITIKYGIDTAATSVAAFGSTAKDRPKVLIKKEEL